MQAWVVWEIAACTVSCMPNQSFQWSWVESNNHTCMFRHSKWWQLYLQARCTAWHEKLNVTPTQNVRPDLHWMTSQMKINWMHEWMNELYFTRVVEKSQGLFTSSPHPWRKLPLTKDTMSYSILSTCTFIQTMLKWTPVNWETSQ